MWLRNNADGQRTVARPIQMEMDTRAKVPVKRMCPSLPKVLFVEVLDVFPQAHSRKDPQQEEIIKMR